MSAASPTASGALGSGALVADDESYVVLTAAAASGSDEGGSDYDDVRGDCWIEVLVYADQIDPEPEKMF